MDRYSSKIKSDYVSIDVLPGSSGHYLAYLVTFGVAANSSLSWRTSIWAQLVHIRHSYAGDYHNTTITHSTAKETTPILASLADIALTLGRL